MNSLIEKYKYFDLNYEDYYLLGLSTPELKVGVDNTSNLVKKFLYTYSFLGLNATDIYNIEQLKCVLENKLNSLKHIDNMSFEQKWWALALIYLQIGAKYHKFDFFISICESILDSIQTITPKELIFYCNSLNDSLSYLIGYELRIRPHMDIQPNIDSLPLYSKLTINHKEIINIFKNYFSKNEIMSKDINREIQLLENIGVGQDHWNIVFDIFVGQMISQIDLESPFQGMSEKDSLKNSIELSILNISEDSEFMPKEITTVSELVTNLILKK